MADIPGDATTTATLSLGASYSSAIDFVGDHDWFKITLTKGQAVDISVALGTLEDSYLSIRDSSGNILYSNDDIVDGVNRASEVKFDPSYTGTYYIDVSAWVDPNQGQGDGYTGTGTYTVSAQPYSPPPLATNDQIANQLTSGYWGGDVHHWNVTQGGTITVDIHALTSAEQTLALAALQEWTDVIGVNFQPVTSGAQIVFSDAEDTSANGPSAATSANWSNGIISSANVDISKSWVTAYGAGLDSYSFQTYIHEIGHALGLGHAGNYNEGGSGSSPITYPYSALFENDAWSTSIMSYFSQQDNSYFANQGFSELYAVSPMVADIVAMQSLYGLSTTTRTGDTIYGDHSNAGGIFNAVAYPDVAYTIFDSGGNDTIDYSLSSAKQLINLNPETFSNVDGYSGNLEIARGVVIENAIGGSGNDILIGNSANNVLTGNAGADTLTGGGGNDVFADTKAGHSGDTITDFHAGDTIVFTDATVGNFTYSLIGNTLTYSGGSMTIDGSVNGRFMASAASSGGVQLAETTTHTQLNDFNGDGLSDLLWQHTNGVITDYLSKTNNGGMSDNGSNFWLNLGAGWHVAATGDFNGDGRADILLENSSGTYSEFLGQSNGALTSSGVSLNPGAGWSIAGVGDFNGDGRADILWRNINGVVTDYLGNSDGSFSDNAAHLWVNPGTNWTVAGTGDFNGDGISDILWRDQGGVVTDYLGNSSGSMSDNASHLWINPGTNWKVVGIGDFNGDGISDILWRDQTSGVVTDYIGTAGGGMTDNASHLWLNPGTNWSVASIGDYNGDGISDILWRDQTGVITDYLGNSSGGLSDNSSHLWINPGTAWTPQDPFVHDPFAA